MGSSFTLSVVTPFALLLHLQTPFVVARETSKRWEHWRGSCSSFRYRERGFSDRRTGAACWTAFSRLVNRIAAVLWALDHLTFCFARDTCTLKAVIWLSVDPSLSVLIINVVVITSTCGTTFSLGCRDELLAGNFMKDITLGLIWAGCGASIT